MQVCSEVPVVEPLLKSVIGVRVDRGRYMVDVSLDLFAIEGLLLRRLGTGLVLDLSGKEQ